MVFGYLLGSMPWGYWIVRWFRGEDVRKTGSGNTGTANVWRNYGPRLGVATALLDVLKGFIPALIGVLFISPTAGVLGASAAMLGHAWPIFLGLSGGKAVATGAGAMLALCPVCALGVVLVWIIVLWSTRYSSLASICGALAFVASTLLFDRDWPVVAFSAAAAIVIVWRHRTNIRRLLAGTETRASTFGRGARRKPRPDVG
jgi:acyl phosphate:glycerol-3-phosphate acyltransferase